MSHRVVYEDKWSGINFFLYVCPKTFTHHRIFQDFLFCVNRLLKTFFSNLSLKFPTSLLSFLRKGKKEEKLGIQSPFFLFSQSFYSKCRFFFAFDSARCHFLSCIIQLSDYTIWNWKVLFKRTFTTFVPYSKKKFKKLIFYNCVQLLGRVDQENFSISSNF